MNSHVAGSSFTKLLLLSLCALLVTGCGVGEGRESASGGDSEAVIPSTASNGDRDAGEGRNFSSTHIPLEKPYTIAAADAAMVYGCYTEGDEIFVTFQNKEDGSIEKEVKLPLSSETGSVQRLSVNPRGAVSVFASSHQGSEHYCWIVDSSGIVSELGDYALEDIASAELITLKDVRADAAGNTYLWYEMALPLPEVEEDVPESEWDVYAIIHRVYVKDGQGNTLFYVQSKDLVGLEVTEEGRATVFFSQEGSLFAQSIDSNAKALSQETIPLMGGRQGGSELPAQFAMTQEGFLFCLEGCLYEYRYDTGQSEKLFALSSHGILAGNILSLQTGDGVIEIIDNYQGSSGLFSLREGTGEKTVVTLGLMQASRQTEEAMAGFNRTSGSVRVELVPYYDQAEGYEAGLERLKLDIVRGKAPDVINVSSIDCTPLADKGVFADLYPLMEGDDQCSPDKIVSSIRKVYEQNGHLYSLGPAFLLHSVWGNAETVGQEKGLMLSEWMELLKSKGKGLDAIYGFSADEPVLTTLCTFGMEEFIDWESGTCDFTGEYFKELLEFAEEYQGGYSGSTLSQGIAQGKILLTLGLITKVADYQLQKELYDGELTFVGYPTPEGSGTAISFWGDELAINAASQKQEAAWEFVGYFFLQGYQGSGFPVHTDQLEEILTEAMEKEMVSDMEGTGEMAKGTYRDLDIRLIVFEAGQEDVDQVRQLMESADRRFKYNTQVLQIINQEAQAYFEGQKSVEAVCEIIQNRVQLYVQEQVG